MWHGICKITSWIIDRIIHLFFNILLVIANFILFWFLLFCIVTAWFQKFRQLTVNISGCLLILLFRIRLPPWLPSINSSESPPAPLLPAHLPMRPYVLRQLHHGLYHLIKHFLDLIIGYIFIALVPSVNLCENHIIHSFHHYLKPFIHGLQPG
jgi:hypothetical protein